MYYCTNETSFVKYFNDNMHELGLPTPTGLFDSIAAITATATALAQAASTFGPGVTFAELAGAGTMLEGLTFISGVTAAFYVGAVIGSLAVAAGKSIGCGASISDAIWEARRLGVGVDWIDNIIVQHPAIISH